MAADREPAGQDAVSEIEGSLETLRKSCSDMQLGILFGNYVEGLVDTQLEGFSPEEQWAIDKFLKDMITAWGHI